MNSTILLALAMLTALALYAWLEFGNAPMNSLEARKSGVTKSSKGVHRYFPRT